MYIAYIQFNKQYILLDLSVLSCSIIRMDIYAYHYDMQQMQLLIMSNDTYTP